MSPISTAHLNPQGLNFCLSPTNNLVLLPVLLNNTNLAGLKYTFTPLPHIDDRSRGRVETHELSAKDLKQVEQTYHERLQLVMTGQPARTKDEYDEYDDDDDDGGSNSPSAQSTLQQTQTLVHILLARPGIVQLERVYDSSNADARLIISEAVVVPCPRVEFADDDTSAAQKSIRCAGQDVDLQLKINVRGVPPLSLRWLKITNGNQEQSLVEGIEADHKDKHLQVDSSLTDTPSSLATTRRHIVQDVNIPLTISLDKAGTYLYALEEITDGVGNVVRVGSDLTSPETDSITQTKTTRSFMVLKKPVVSFAHCSSEMPTSLLIGSEATLTIKYIESDNFDAPWDISLYYQTPADAKSSKQLKPWKKTLKAQGKSLTFRTSTPGDYKILDVTGKVSVAISLQFQSLIRH